MLWPGRSALRSSIHRPLLRWPPGAGGLSPALRSFAFTLFCPRLFTLLAVRLFTVFFFLTGSFAGFILTLFSSFGLVFPFFTGLALPALTGLARLSLLSTPGTRSGAGLLPPRSGLTLAVFFIFARFFAFTRLAFAALFALARLLRIILTRLVLTILSLAAGGLSSAPGGTPLPSTRVSAALCRISRLGRFGQCKLDRLLLSILPRFP